MNATHILSRWRRVRGVLNKPSMWFILLTIAEAGGRGIARVHLANSVSMKCESLTHSMRILVRAGLVTEQLAERTSKCRPANIATITPKGLQFLCLSPMPETSSAEVEP